MGTFNSGAANLSETVRWTDQARVIKAREWHIPTGGKIAIKCKLGSHLGKATRRRETDTSPSFKQAQNIRLLEREYNDEKCAEQGLLLYVLRTRLQLFESRLEPRKEEVEG